MPRDVYDRIGDKIEAVHEVLGSIKDPSRTMSRAHQYANEAAALLPGTVPAAGTPEHQRYQLAQIKINNASDEIRGYARRAMAESVDDVYRRIGDTEFGVARRGSGVVNFRLSKHPVRFRAGIGPGSASRLRQKLSEAERYIQSSETYIGNVLDGLDRMGLKQPDDDALKAELDARLADAEKTIGRQKAEFGGAERAKAIRRASRLP